MTRQRSVFDIIGPVMIGPSSSHTAGAVRLGNLARAVFGQTPRRVRVVLHGSFAETGPGHGTDLALVAGLLGFSPDDGRIRDALTHAERSELAVTFATGDLGEVHPNTALFELEGPTGEQMRIQGSSLGGGDVVVTRVDDYDVDITGELPVLVVGHLDQPGEIAAVSRALADAEVNIAAMRVARERRGGGAIMLIDTDAAVSAEVAESLRALPGVTSVRRVDAI